MNPEVTIGQGPLLLAQPHGGVEVPDAIFARLNPLGQALADTDWHISRLYAGLVADATVVSTPVHRYVIDANRDPSDQSLYPGQNTTSLCPTTNFDGDNIYLAGQAPSTDEIRERQQRYHQPYLFDGKLPDFNIGSNSGTSCSPTIEAAVYKACDTAQDYSAVINGRFKGGWTTRHYGEPERGFHAIQMELAQCCYMQEQAPWRYDESKAGQLRVILAAILQSLVRVFD